MNFIILLNMLKIVEILKFCFVTLFVCATVATFAINESVQHCLVFCKFKNKTTYSSEFCICEYANFLAWHNPVSADFVLVL